MIIFQSALLYEVYFSLINFTTKAMTNKGDFHHLTTIQNS